MGNPAAAREPTMELGRVGIWTNQLDSLRAAQLRDTVQEVEGLGYQSLWCPEFTLGREAFTNAALLLSVTERLLVATGVASIQARDASAAALAQRVLCETFPYRFILGLGLGHQDAMHGDNDDQPLSAMRNYLRGIDVQPAGDLPAPPEPPSRVLAAIGPEMLELARDHAQGAHQFLVTPEHTHSARGILGPGRLLAPEQGVLLEQDPEKARSILRSELTSRLQCPDYRESLLSLGWNDEDFSDGGTDALIDRLFAWGTVSDVEKRVDEHLAAGADHVALYVLGGKTTGAPIEEWRQLATLIRQG
jgi:probable F420-dependent oxidoreductase